MVWGSSLGSIHHFSQSLSSRVLIMLLNQLKRIKKKV